MPHVFDNSTQALRPALIETLRGRPLRNDNEINPDALGYIFEKYLNQKQLGVYYT